MCCCWVLQEHWLGTAPQPFPFFPLQDTLCCSPYIKFAMLIGQNHRALGALVVPDQEALAELATGRGEAGAATACTPACMDWLHVVEALEAVIVPLVPSYL